MHIQLIIRAEADGAPPSYRVVRMLIKIPEKQKSGMMQAPLPAKTESFLSFNILYAPVIEVVNDDLDKFVIRDKTVILRKIVFMSGKSIFH